MRFLEELQPYKRGLGVNPMQETDKLTKAKKWFEEVTEADSNLIGFMGISQAQLIEMYENEGEKPFTPWVPRDWGYDR